MEQKNFFQQSPKSLRNDVVFKEFQKFKLAVNWGPAFPDRYMEIPGSGFSCLGGYWTSLANVFKPFPHQKIVFSDTRNQPSFPYPLLHPPPPPRESEVSEKNAAFLGIICMSGLFASLSERLYSWSPFHKILRLKANIQTGGQKNNDIFRYAMSQKIYHTQLFSKNNYSSV